MYADSQKQRLGTSRNSGMTPIGSSRLTGGYNSISDEGNRELYHQLMHNILESVNISDDEAFERVFFDWNKENYIRDLIADANNNEFTIKDFTSQYASKLLQYNSAFLDLKDMKDRFQQTVSILDTQKFVRGKKFHYIDPSVEENVLVCSISQVQNLEGEPMVKLYLYIDDSFAFKTRVYPKSSNPFINLDIDIEEAQNADFDDSRTMRSEMDDDDDKVLYPKLGKTEITIDKEFPTYRNIYLQDPDANYSEDDEQFNQLISTSNKAQPLYEVKNMMQTKGRVHLVFTAELSEEFAQRTEELKKFYVTDTLKKIDQLSTALTNKKNVVSQAIECLYHIQFEPERGLILDQLNSVMDDGSSQMTDLSHMALDKVYKGTSTTASQSQRTKDDNKRLKQRNQREIDKFEKENSAAHNPNASNRLCGCDANCLIF
ncbi:UNKNOWN [Stylonychia lemnae]|uniref:Uncharacterized protein n=1 Tax=Stylonychia lemnae TaxID=5949 RepID=A0A078AK05_STYLE|nr:UNKNOWN [Stylonychia lemnae]|eukprot:CDW81787.1 UNKNOWN [Stylonychia lemnae]